MSTLEIYMYKSSLNFWELLKFYLQWLTNIMSFVQKHFFWQNYVNLHKIMRTKSVCSYCVNVLDIFMVVPYQLG